MKDTVINNAPIVADGRRGVGRLTITTERIDVSTRSPAPDLRWEYTDAAGHYHARSVDEEDPLPSLDVQTEHVPCGNGCDGDCDGYTVIAHFRCRLCAEEITPGIVPGPHHAAIDGRQSWQVDIDQRLPMAGRVTVAVLGVGGRVTHFGIAEVTDVAADHHGFRSTLVGVGPLGVRGAA